MFGDPKALVLAKRILKRTWGFPDFKHKQQEAIVRLIEGANAVVIFSTGGGKSLEYQVPALAFDEYDRLCGRSDDLSYECQGKSLVYQVSVLAFDEYDRLCGRSAGNGVTNKHKTHDRQTLVAKEGMGYLRNRHRHRRS